MGKGVVTRVKDRAPSGDWVQAASSQVARGGTGPGEGKGW